LAPDVSRVVALAWHRFEAVFLKACQILQQGRLGEIIKLDLVSDMPMNTANKYYTSQWRRDFANGQMIDSGVHFIAGLRMVAAAAGLGEAVRPSAQPGAHLIWTLEPADCPAFWDSN
jgi:predicted dehydrogenase